MVNPIHNANGGGGGGPPPPGNNNLEKRVGLAALSILAEASEGFAGKYYPVLNLKQFFESGTVLYRYATETGITHKVALESLLKVSVSGVLIVTGLYYSHMFKKVFVITALVQNIHSLATADQRNMYEMGEKLAKLGITSISLAAEFYYSPVILVAKVTSKVAFELFKAHKEYKRDHYVESAQAIITAVVIGYKGQGAFSDLFDMFRPETAESSNNEPENEEPVILPPSEAPEIIVIEEPKREMPVANTPITPPVKPIVPTVAAPVKPVLKKGGIQR